MTSSFSEICCLHRDFSKTCTFQTLFQKFAFSGTQNV